MICGKVELEKMDPFNKKTFIEERVPEESQQIPPGELDVRRGTRVEATDGYVGNVDEFVVNPEDGHITHMVMREGHRWGQKDVIIKIRLI